MSKWVAIRNNHVMIICSKNELQTECTQLCAALVTCLTGQGSRQILSHPMLQQHKLCQIPDQQTTPAVAVPSTVQKTINLSSRQPKNDTVWINF